MIPILPPIVVKVGGSLYDWPELGPRLRQVLAMRTTSPIIIVPGGGALADAVRALDRAHGLNPEAAHWLALHALSLAAGFLAELLPGAKIIEGLTAARSDWPRDHVVVLDMARFAREDESRPDHLPHSWAATSDAFAARVAHVAKAERLVLLKSATLPAGLDWLAAAQRGYVDELFPSLVASATFSVEAINLRSWRPAV